MGRVRVEWHYIVPGKPMQNASIEGFDGRRDELLNETLFNSLSLVPGPDGAATTTARGSSLRNVEAPSLLIQILKGQAR